LGSEVLTAVKMTVVFWIGRPCVLAGRYQRFGETTLALKMATVSAGTCQRFGERSATLKMKTVACVYPKPWYLPVSPLGVTNKKTNIVIQKYEAT
jgi:hypothetical protein